MLEISSNDVGDIYGHISCFFMFKDESIVQKELAVLRHFHIFIQHLGINTAINQCLKVLKFTLTVQLKKNVISYISALY